ncbi:TPR-like protein, partial [Ceratobasidium sp. AG-I]
RCPPPSRVFTGRQNILDQMDSYFSQAVSLERRLFVLHGLGGAGKTQLALKFVQSHKALFWDIFYIDATTRETISAGLTALAKACGSGATPEEGLAWLVSHEERWLLVLNNADDPDLNLHEFLPSCDHGDILITTRNQQVVSHATGPESYCRVGGMRPDDALGLLLKSSGADRTEETELGNFALAIVQAGAYMRARQCGVAEYFRIFQKARAHLLRERPSKQMSDYNLSVFATWEISFRQLGSRAVQLLHLMSILHHEGISEAFFEVSSSFTSYEPEIPLTESQNATKTIIFDFLSSLRTLSDEWNPLALKHLTDQLRAFSLLDYDTHSCSYSMHPLVQEWCRNTAPDATDVRECATWLLALCVEEKFESEDYAFRRRLLPHLLAVCGGQIHMVPELAKILGLVSFEAGYAKENEALLTIAVQASRDALGSEHPTTLTCMHNLAHAFWEQGRLEEAETLQTEVVEVSKRVLGHVDPDTLSSMHVLALTYHNQERWQETEKLLLEVIEARKWVIGAEHRSTLNSMGMLASTYWSQGRLDEAELLDVEVLETMQRVLGREHPDTLLTMHNLASTYEEQGKMQKAEELMAETVALETQVLGESHVKTQKSVRYLEGIQQRIQSELLSADVP